MSPRAQPEGTKPVRARWRYHLGLPGGVYVFVTLLVALGAFNSQNNLLFWVFGFALALLIVSGMLSRAVLMGVEVVREVPAPLAEGETGVVHYRVRNRNRWMPAFALTIAEVGPVSRARRERGAEAAPRLAPVRAFVPHVAGGRTVVAAGAARALRRGTARLDAVLVSTAFPFGIVKKSLLFEQEGQVLVRPRVVSLPHGFVNNALRTGDRGSLPTRRPGAGDEFFSLRDYQPGDAMRSVAWRASARRGELLIRQTASPAPMRMQIVLSLARSPGADADEEAIRLAASAAEAAVSRNLAVGLRVLGQEAELRPRDGRLQRELIMDALAVLEPEHLRGTPTPDSARREAMARQLRSPGVLVVVHAGPIDETLMPPWAVHLTPQPGAAPVPPHPEAAGVP